MRRALAPLALVALAPLALVALAPLALVALAPLAAQSADQARRELEATRRDAAAADRRAISLAAQATASERQLAASMQAVAEVERSLAAHERALSAARARLTQADLAARAHAATLAGARAPLADLIAALVRRQRRPAGLDLFAQTDLTRTIRLRAALAGVAPELERRTAALRARVAAAAAERAEASQVVATIAAERRARDADRVRLGAALALAGDRRNAARGEAEAARQQADGIVEQGAALEALIARLGAQAAIGARLAALTGPDLRPGTAVAPPPAPAYRLPLSGRLLAGFGEPSSTGVHMRGLLLATSPHAPVRAPARGRIAYAGAFRTWRAIAIIDHGHGWTTLLAGLDGVAVRAGNEVRQGDPLGRSGARLLIELRHRGWPVDVAALAEASS